MVQIAKDGFVIELTQEEFDETFANPNNESVNKERDRRLLAGSGFTPSSYESEVMVNSLDEPNLNGLATLAIVQSNLGNGSSTVQWRDNNNTLHTLTYDQMIELYGMAAAYKQQVYAASWVIKDMDPIPRDFEDDSYWP